VAKSLRGFGFRQPIVVDLRLLRVRLSRECPDDLAGKHCEYGVPLGDVRVGEDRIRASESKLPLETPFPGKEVSACPNHRPKQPRFISPRLISICGGRGSRVYASERFSRDGSPPVLPSFFLLPSILIYYLSILKAYMPKHAYHCEVAKTDMRSWGGVHGTVQAAFPHTPSAVPGSSTGKLLSLTSDLPYGRPDGYFRRGKGVVEAPGAGTIMIKHSCWSRARGHPGNSD
jgi:hypothetical protein